MAGNSAFATGFDESAFRVAIRETMPDASERFLSKIDFGEDCWLWTAGLNRGYGVFWRDGGMRRVTRLVLDALGVTVDSLVVDHLCSRTACVRPSHLRAVTQAENLLASPLTLPGASARKTHCVRGHSLMDSANVQGRPGRVGRWCRTCKREADRKRYRERHGR